MDKIVEVIAKDFIDEKKWFNWYLWFYKKEIRRL